MKKTIQKWASVLLMLLFIAIIIVTCTKVAGIKDTVAGTVSLTDLNDLDKLTPFVNSLYLSIILLGLTGCAAVALAIAAFNSGSEVKIVHVERKTEAKQEKEEELVDEATLLAEAMQEADTRIDRIKTQLKQVNDPALLGEKLLQVLCTELEAVQGALFHRDSHAGKATFRMSASYAYFHNDATQTTYEVGEGLIGQVAKEGRVLNISAVPEGYLTILSGLGQSEPAHLMIFPVHTNGQISAIMEIASFKAFGPAQEKIINATALLLTSWKPEAIQSELVSPEQV
jgi:hypothetical protein